MKLLIIAFLIMTCTFCTHRHQSPKKAEEVSRNLKLCANLEVDYLRDGGSILLIFRTEADKGVSILLPIPSSPDDDGILKAVLAMPFRHGNPTIPNRNRATRVSDPKVLNEILHLTQDLEWKGVLFARCAAIRALQGEKVWAKTVDGLWTLH